MNSPSFPLLIWFNITCWLLMVDWMAKRMLSSLLLSLSLLRVSGRERGKGEGREGEGEGEGRGKEEEVGGAGDIPIGVDGLELNLFDPPQDLFKRWRI